MINFKQLGDDWLVYLDNAYIGCVSYVGGGIWHASMIHTGNDETVIGPWEGGMWMRAICIEWGFAT